MNTDCQLNCIDFLIGSIAPDCGVPNQDWSKFTPEKTITHWQLDGKNIDAENFKEKYVVKNGNGFSFYLGYYFHLLTDIAFSRYFKSVTEQIRADATLTQKITQDYLNQDFVYLQNHPNSVFYTVFSKIKEFDNNYLGFFSKDAFTQRIRHITNNYLAESKHTVSEFPIIYKLDLDLFVRETIMFIVARLSRQNFRGKIMNHK
ncbi:MAG: zinc dependent phospholipase C family protein [Bacteroidales bacterium]